MDSIEHREVVLDNFSNFNSVSFVPRQSRSYSPQAEKLRLIQKIQFYLNQNKNLQIKQQSLQNNVSDLRKLVETAGTQNTEYMEKIEEQINELNNKASRMSSALKYSFKDGNHLKNCALFWKEYVE